MATAGDEIKGACGEWFYPQVGRMLKRACLCDKRMQLVTSQACQKLVPVPHVNAQLVFGMQGHKARSGTAYDGGCGEWACSYNDFRRNKGAVCNQVVAQFISQSRDLTGALD
jgi:hypothetical protein